MISRKSRIRSWWIQRRVEARRQLYFERYNGSQHARVRFA